jgi:hypothetical protein
MAGRAIWLSLPLAVVALASAARIQAAEPDRGGAQAQAPVDITGYWVAIVSQEWRFRMVVPGKGEFSGIPLNLAAKQYADAYDPEQEKGDACMAYGAPALMRMPLRLHITWENPNTLRIETDAGQQTRLLRFDALATRGAPSRQGDAKATWLTVMAPFLGGGRGGAAAGARSGAGAPPAGGAPLGGVAPAGGAPPGAGIPAGGVPPPAKAQFGTLQVMTDNLLPGLLRKNGVPYSDRATVEEYWKLLPVDQGLEYLSITSIVRDPVYFQGSSYTTTPIFMREPDGSKWRPSPCSLRSVP